MVDVRFCRRSLPPLSSVLLGGEMGRFQHSLVRSEIGSNLHLCFRHLRFLFPSSTTECCQHNCRSRSSWEPGRASCEDVADQDHLQGFDIGHEDTISFLLIRQRSYPDATILARLHRHHPSWLAPTRTATGPSADCRKGGHAANEPLDAPC